MNWPLVAILCAGGLFVSTVAFYLINILIEYIKFWIKEHSKGDKK